MKFEWDPAKSVINEAKHGIGFAAASALWSGSVITIPSKNPGELRHLAIGVISGKHWTVVYTPKTDCLRLISARRSRKNEKALFQALSG